MGFFLTGTYRKHIVELDLGADYELVSETIKKLGYVRIITAVIISTMNFVWINTMLNAMLVELEILVDIFEELATAGDDLMNEFRIAVQKHRQYFDFVGQVQHITSPCFLIQYYPTQIILVTVIVLFRYDRGSGFELGYLMHGVLLLLQFWYICNYVENLESKCDQIGEIIYNRPWYAEQHRRMIRSYLFIIARSQHGLRFKCGGFFYMSMESLADLLRMSSSLLAFITSFK
ncbi:uncharacterized protein LOC129719278 [Wyeomyia smithii]|uniref:uncharacterized protein LOC129719278 n=1 Tax=Wyeomyia smithii TaxID=174621 RepID=UPI002467C193|nr:uncharacterized protein LOC129719278 [Wyeomyia smithii]